MQIASIAKKLELVGLSEKQSKVYVASLFLGPSSVQRIAEQAEVNRATTYVILDELLEMGLASETSEGKKTLFVAEPPEAIDRYLSSMEKEISNRREQLKNSIKELKSINRSELTSAPVVRFFKGPEATSAVSSYLIRKAKKNDVVYSLSDIDEVLKILPNILKEGPKRRRKKNITSKLFYSGSIEVETDSKTGRQTHKISQKILGDVNIYSNTMAILSYKGNESTGVVIESEEIVAVIRQLFELAWNSKDNTK